jgi:NADH-quinone oxidoreductase subunit G
MPTIYLDGEAFEVKEGANLLEACLGLGKDLPYFCWHPALGSAGACRQCAVIQYTDENDSSGRLVMSCMTPVTEGARFSLDADDASKFRKMVIESLMLNHPHDCPVCAEGGECHLQDMTVMVGHGKRRYRGRKNTHRNQYLGPLINHEMNRCISCYRCVRYYQDYAGGTDLSAQASHDHVYFGRQQDGVLESEFAGNLVEVCPTGVFTDKTLGKDYSRKWDLQSAPSICVGCAVGCNITPGERYGRLKRIHNRFNSEVNGYFLCDRGRFGGGFVNREDRLLYQGKRQPDGSFRATDTYVASNDLVEMFYVSTNVVAIGSPRASLEANYLIRRLVGEENYCPGYSDTDLELSRTIYQVMRNGSAVSPSIRQVEEADAVLVLGEDVSNTAPRMALAIRQSVRNQARNDAAAIGLQYWQDAATRTLAQDKRNPLFTVSLAGTRLDDIASETAVMLPDDIARLGYAIANVLDAGTPPVQDIDDSLAQLAATIAEALSAAKKPLIVSGTGCLNKSVVTAASAIAEALVSGSNKPMLGYCLPEANSLGVTMLDEGKGLSLSEVRDRALKGEIDALMVMENDLSRRGLGTELDLMLEKVKRLIVVDSLENETMANADYVLPASTFAESEGTLVSSEGRAQRYFPVFEPREDVLACWQGIGKLAEIMKREGMLEVKNFDDVVAACARDIPALAGISEVVPGREFRNRGLKIPRQPPRYSGRTAMRADVSVHEPKQTEDNDTPFSFSMEGLNGPQPGSLLPFVWSPGWNSNQSLHKFQDEASGRLKGGPAGVRLIEPGNGNGELPVAAVPPAPQPRPGQYQLLPLYQVFGSEELTAKSPAIAELAGEAYLAMSSTVADSLQVSDGDGVSVHSGKAAIELAVRIVDSLPDGGVGYPVGLPGTELLVAGAAVSLGKVENWQRRPEIISSDAGGRA